MSQFERLYEIDKRLRGRAAPSKRRLMEALEISEATLKRDIEYMRDRLGAPIRWDRRAGGYQYDPGEAEFTLPGFWFSAAEVHALLLLTQIIDQIQPGFLRDQIQPFHERLQRMAVANAGNSESLSARVRFIQFPTRITSPEHLGIIVRATLSRRRVEIRYESRGRGAQTERVISPACLLFYRGNWYVDAWCHTANGERRFAVDAVLSARILDAAARKVAVKSTKTGYGIFAGAPTNTAVLRFSDKAARWVRIERWHQDQRLKTQADGAVVLEVPYSHKEEIVMDILRHGEKVEVLGPPDLRDLVADTLEAAVGLYRRTRRAPSREIRSKLKHAAG